MGIRKTGPPFRAVILLCTAFFLPFLVGCSTLEQRNSLLDREIWTASHSIRPFTGNPKTLYRQGLQYQGRGQHKLAIDAFRQVLQADPHNIKAINAMAVSLDKLGDFEEATALYHAALTLDSGLDYIHNNLGYSYLLQGKPDLAIQSFEHALALAPENRRYRNNLGMAHARQGNFGAALAYFSRNPEQVPPGYGADSSSKAVSPGTEPPDARTSHGAHQGETNAGQARESAGWCIAVNPNSGALSSGSVAGRAEPEEPARQSARSQAFGDPEPAVGPTADLTEQVRKTVNPEPAATGYADSRAGHTRPPEEDRLPVRNERGEGCLTSKEPSDSLARLSSDDAMAPRQEPRNNPPGQEPLATPLRSLGFRDFLSAVPIEVHNGNGVQGMARQVGAYLKTLGYNVADIANAAHFNHSRTLIFFQEGYLPMAEDLAATLPGGGELRPTASVSSAQSVRVKVIIGGELNPQDLVPGQVPTQGSL